MPNVTSVTPKLTQAYTCLQRYQHNDTVVRYRATKVCSASYH